MSSESSAGPRRVLQVLGHTDATDHNQAALALHEALLAEESAGSGWEIRTLALAPGRSAGLGQRVPVMAPVSRSLAAMSQLRTEQRWADVVLARGIEAVKVVSRTRGPTPWVASLWAEPQGWVDGQGSATRVVAALRRSQSTVANSSLALEALSKYLDSIGDASSFVGKLSAIDEALGFGVPPSAVRGTTSAAARLAARAALGVDTRPVAVTVISLDSPLRGRRRAGQSTLEVEGILNAAAESLPEVTVLSRDTSDPELVLAAADVVVVNGGAAGPSAGLLQQIVNGALAVAPSWPALDDLLDDSRTAIRLPEKAIERDSLVKALKAAASDADKRQTMVERCARMIEDQRDPQGVAARWVDCLTAALPSRP